MKAIKELNFSKWESKKAFKKAGGRILNNPTLFGTDWSLTERGLCGWCGNKLKVTLKGVQYCRGAKHPQKTFVLKSRSGC